MLKKKIGKILISPIFILFALCILLCSCKKEQEKNNVEDVSFREFYTVGTTISVPSAYFESGGKRFDADSVVVFPDGNAYSSDEICLTAVGEYKITYDSTEGGRYYYKEFVLKVVSSFNAVNNKKPEILIDFGAVDGDNLPEAIVGYRYPVFDASAMDSKGNDCPAAAAVFYGSSDGRTDVFADGGFFYVRRPGYYTIVYTARDIYGNVARKEIDVHASIVDSDFSVAADDLGNYVAGSVVDLNVCRVICEDAYAPKINIKVFYGGEEIDCSDGRFVPLKAGVYTAKYFATDILGRSAECEKEFAVFCDGKAFFSADSSFALPKYLMAGHSYDLPKISAYNADGESIDADIKIDYGDGLVSVGESFIPESSEKSRKVEIVYCALDAELRFERIVYNPYGGGYCFMNYFSVGGDAELYQLDDCILISSAHSGSVTFMNDLSAALLQVGLSVDSDSDVGSFNIYLEDSLCPEVRVKLCFEKGNVFSSLFKVNDGEVIRISPVFDDPENDFSFSYDNKRKVVTIADVECVIANCLSGEQFDGFPSGSVIFSVEINDVLSRSGIFLKNLNGQTFTQMQADLVSPVAVLSGNIDASRKIGDVIVIPSARAFDVLDRDITCYVSVKCNGEYVKKADGSLIKNVPTDMEYFVTVSENGFYSVQYLLTDSSGNERRVSYVIIVYDETPPVITMVNSLSDMSVGQRFVSPKATAEDDTDGEVSVSVILKKPDGSMEYVSSKTVLSDSGEYTAIFLAIDSVGNVAIKEVIFRVK